MTGTQTGLAVAAAATTVGVVAESGADERRVALVPKAVSTLVNSGVPVVVESGAGSVPAPDQLYTDAGATIGDAWAADVVVKVAPPSVRGGGAAAPGQTLIGFLAPRNADNQIGALKQRGVQAFAVEAIPRISRAQVMDALSSQANVAGYKAVVLAAAESTRFFPMLTTAAGTVKPASVLVLGVGGGPAGARDGQAPRRAHHRVRRPPGWPTRSARSVPNGSIWASRRRLGRLRPRAHRGGARPAAEEARAGHRRLRRGDHHRPGARPARPRLVTAAAVEG